MYLSFVYLRNGDKGAAAETFGCAEGERAQHVRARDQLGLLSVVRDTEVSVSGRQYRAKLQGAEAGAGCRRHQHLVSGLQWWMV